MRDPIVADGRRKPPHERNVAKDHDRALA
jgi:hypothetical protein